MAKANPTIELSKKAVSTTKAKSEYKGLLEDHPIDTLVKVRSLIALHESVDWEEGAMIYGHDGGIVVLTECIHLLSHCIEQMAKETKPS